MSAQASSYLSIRDQQCATDVFGHAVAINSNYAVIGDPADSVNGDQAGAAYLVDVPTGNILHVLRGLPGPLIDTFENNFGSAVAMDDKNAYIGSPGNGYVYQFDLASGALVRRIRGSDTRSSDNFGNDIAVDNGRVLVGGFDHQKIVAGTTVDGAANVFDAQTGAQLNEFVVPTRSGRLWPIWPFCRP